MENVKLDQISTVSSDFKFQLHDFDTSVGLRIFNPFKKQKQLS